MDKLEKQPCPMCGKNTLTLLQDEMDVPYFGKVFIMSMTCSSCNYRVADVEAAETKEPCKIEFEIDNEKDMKVRVVKSSEATVKIPSMRMSMESGPGSDGFISNIEGLLDKFKAIIEGERDTTEDDKVKKSCKNLLKKLWKVKLGDVKLKVVIEDPTGNSAIVSEKAKVSKLKK